MTARITPSAGQVSTMARQLCADQHAADLGLDRDARRGDQRADEVVLVVGVEAEMRLRLGEEHGLHRRAFEQDAFHGFTSE